MPEVEPYLMKVWDTTTTGHKQPAKLELANLGAVQDLAGRPWVGVRTICVCMCVCVYVCMCVYIYIYTNTSKSAARRPCVLRFLHCRGSSEAEVSVGLPLFEPPPPPLCAGFSPKVKGPGQAPGRHGRSRRPVRAGRLAARGPGGGARGGGSACPLKSPERSSHEAWRTPGRTRKKGALTASAHFQAARFHARGDAQATLPEPLFGVRPKTQAV